MARATKPTHLPVKAAASASHPRGQAVLQDDRWAPSGGLGAVRRGQGDPNDIALTSYHLVPSSRRAAIRWRAESRSCPSISASAASTLREIAASRSRCATRARTVAM